MFVFSLLQIPTKLLVFSLAPFGILPFSPSPPHSSLLPSSQHIEYSFYSSIELNDDLDERAREKLRCERSMLVGRWDWLKEQLVGGLEREGHRSLPGSPTNESNSPLPRITPTIAQATNIISPRSPTFNLPSLTPTSTSIFLPLSHTTLKYLVYYFKHLSLPVSSLPDDIQLEVLSNLLTFSYRRPELGLGHLRFLIVEALHRGSDSAGSSRIGAEENRSGSKFEAIGVYKAAMLGGEKELQTRALWCIMGVSNLAQRY